MRFGRAHRILTTSLAVLGIVAVVGTVPLPGLLPAQLMVEGLVAAQLVALATRRGAANDALVFVLTLLHFLAATVLGGGLAFVVAFIGLAVVLPAALVLSHLRREVEGNYHQGARDRTGLPVDVPRILRSRRVMGRGALVALGSLSLPILAMTALLFVVLPRVGVSPRGQWLSGFALDPRAGLVHFTDGVDLRQRGELRSDPSVALRFRVEGLREPPARMPLRFRGATLDTFDGHRWSRTTTPSPASIATGHARTDRAGRAMLVERESFEPAAIFVPSGTLALEMLDAPVDDELPRRWRVWVSTAPGHESVVLGESLSATERARHLALPDGQPKRIAQLAHAWADGEPTPEAKARAIEQHLKSDLAYSRSSPSRGVDQPLDHFVFESKRGHCELFASAMVVMLREVGIPSRQVTGFVGGTYNRFGGYYVVRQGEAHAWVEAYVDGAQGGWRTFDPTPAATEPEALGTSVLTSARDLGDAFSERWGNELVDYDRQTQAVMVQALRAPVVITVVAFLAVLSLLAIRRGATGRIARALRGSSQTDAASSPREADADAAAALYTSLEEALGVHGIVRDRALPPLAHAEHLAREHHPLAEVVLDLTRVYLEARFGGRALTSDARRDFALGLTRISGWQRV